MARRYTERWFNETMEALDIDIDRIENSNDLRREMSQARWKGGGRFGVPQTRSLRQKLSNFFSHGIEPKIKRAQVIRSQQGQEKQQAAIRAEQKRISTIRIKGFDRRIQRDSKGRFTKLS